MDNEVAEARARLAAKFGKVQLGGKGTSSTVIKILTFARHCSFSLALDLFIRPLICCLWYRYLKESAEETQLRRSTKCCLRRQETQGSYQEVW